MKNISIVVAAYQSEKRLESCLRAIKDSTYKDYELIVIMNGDTCKAQDIAKQHADHLISFKRNLGRSYARNKGIKQAQGEIVVCIDSDIVIKQDALEKIAGYFKNHKEVDALTGLLSQEHPHMDFFSQYKNLYMNYIFKKLPLRVSFLFGSICAFRSSLKQHFSLHYSYGEDTELGQRLAQQGTLIAFLPDLEVIHLKKYSFVSFVRNNFLIPYFWSRIFFQYQGWKQLVEQGRGFAHSPREQIVSIILAPLIFITLSTLMYGHRPVLFIACLLTIWFLLNIRFFWFLSRCRNSLFGIVSIPVTFLDHLVMASGVLCGSLKFLLRERNRV